jgi:hypothetical protein
MPQGIAARSAKLTMITPGKLDAAEAWTMFEVGLEAMGLAAVVKGKVYEIVELSNAKDAALAIRSKFPDGGNGVVRLLVRPQPRRGRRSAQRARAGQVANGVVTPLPNLRALLVTDQARHVARMRTLVDELDRPGDGAGVWAVPVTAAIPRRCSQVLDPAPRDGPRRRAPRRRRRARPSWCPIAGSAPCSWSAAATIYQRVDGAGRGARSRSRRATSTHDRGAPAQRPRRRGGDRAGAADLGAPAARTACDHRAGQARGRRRHQRGADAGVARDTQRCARCSTSSTRRAARSTSRRWCSRCPRASRQLGVELAHRQPTPATARSPSAATRPAGCRR